MSLFDAKNARDPFYRDLRDAGSDRPDLVQGREFAEQLWSVSSAFLDTDFPRKAAEQFHQCFWEMYLAAMLLDAGLELVPRRERSRPDVGPDIQIRPNIWIEAVTASGGTGNDAVRSDIGAAGSAVPDNEMKLRLLSAVSEKHRRLIEYRKASIVLSNEPYLIAVNAALVPAVRLERTVPRIVRAVYEVGDEVFMVSTSTGKVVDRAHEHQPSVSKRSGSFVSQGAFVDGSCREVSACLYSAADAVNGPRALGRDLVFVHNATAVNCVPRNLIRRGLEYWLNSDQVEWFDHDSSQRR